ncbi:MAG: HAD-IIB family hydrolase [Bdellovibrionales bacterium]|nr:HAD-IIB family hydrolase [Bdellovibrionales bacterium]
MEESQEIKLFASDLDGTLIPVDESPDPQQLREFHDLIQSRSEFTLAYVTGRHFELALAGLALAGLPVPHYLVCDVGTSIYRSLSPLADKFDPSSWRPMESYSRQLSRLWDKNAVEVVEDTLLKINGVSLQEGEKQGNYKRSFYCTELSRELKEALAPWRERLCVVESFAVDSHYALIDLLPRGVNKLYAVRFILEELQMSPLEAVYAGDSGNDIALFESEMHGIVVGNAHQEVKAAVLANNWEGGENYIARGKTIAGVLEGLQYFGVRGG